MSYEVWGDNDEEGYRNPDQLIKDGWWDEDTVSRVKAAIDALRKEVVYEDGEMNKCISVRFIMRLIILSAEAGFLPKDDPIAAEAYEALKL